MPGRVRRCTSAGEDGYGVHRRPVLAAGILSVAGAWFAGLLGGCAGGPAARPTAATRKTRLVFQAAAQGSYSFASPALWPAAQELLLAALDPFLAQHPGIDVVLSALPVDPAVPILAGTGPDIVQVESRSGLIQQGLLLDLTDYIRQSNLDVGGLYSPGALGVLGAGARIYALPYYTETTAMAVHLDLLDALGVEYPPERWDWQTWAQWARKTAAAMAGRAKGGAPGYATTIQSVGGYDLPAGCYFAGWGGAIADPAQPSRCVLDSPAAVACGEFLFGLIRDRVAQRGSDAGGQLVVDRFLAGKQASAVDQQGFVLRDAVALRSAKWRYWPMPTLPRGAFCFTNANLVGINAYSPHPDAAWELLAWISADPSYERTLMHATLYPPALKQLQGEWVAQVHAVAPTMVDKNVEVFAAQVASATLVPEFGAVFAAAEAQALGILNGYTQQVLEGRLSVEEAFRQAAHEVNVLEQTALAEQSAAQAAQKAFPTIGPAIAQVPTGV
jgi:ABC-type glycerol-3-phosphate transport system substrate-binding protein